MIDPARNLKGIIVPLLTPFTPDGRVDEPGLRSLANYVTDGGVDGIFVMGTTGEFMHLPDEAQWPAIDAVVDEVGHRTLVAAGVTGISVEATIRNIVMAAHLPHPPHALVLAPLCYHSNRKLPRHMERLCSVSDLPVILYNNIGIVERRWKRKDIIPELVARIARNEKILAIKDSSGNMDYLNRLLAGGVDHFKIFQGEESRIWPALANGAAGGVPSIGNILPKLCVRLYRSHLDGDGDLAQNCQEAIIELHNVYLKYGCIPHFLKEYLRRREVIEHGTAFQPFSGDLGPVMRTLEEKIHQVEERFLLEAQ